MRTFLQDLRYGIRVALSQPGYSLTIVLTLALAIGANTVIFSFANFMLLRPLPMRDQDTIAYIFMVDPQRGGDRGTLSIPDLLDYRSALSSFESIAGTTPTSVTLSGRGDAMALTGAKATANLFDTWGLRMAAGQPFLRGDDLPGAADVVVLSHKFWHRQFQGDPSIVGQSIVLDGRPHTIRGVVTPDLEIGNLSLIDVWVPLTLNPDAPRDVRNIRTNGRLRAGASFEQANAEVRAVSERLQRDHPTTNAGWTARLALAREAMIPGDSWIILGLLAVVVGFVLLIACANIANLVLARATGRRRELAVRVALGASRVRMIRQLLTEGVLYGVLGGALALAIAYASLAIIKATAYEPFLQLVVIDRAVLVFTTILALVTPLVFSVLPALQSSRPDVNETLKDSGTRAGGGVRGRRSRAVLVVSQLSLAMALLIVSTLLVRTMIAMSRTDFGFDPTGILTMRADAPAWRYPTDAAVTDYYDGLFARLRALPGNNVVASVDRLPVLGGESIGQVTVDGYAPPRPEDHAWAAQSIASEQFFAASDIPLVAGRVFEAADTPDTVPVAVVNEEMSRRYWGDPRRAIGGRFQIDRDAGRWIQVVGIVGNLRRMDLRGGSNPQVYLAARQRPTRTMAIMIRGREAEHVTAAVRDEVRALDANVAVQSLRTMQEAFDDEFSGNRMLTGMFASFAVLALILAGSGLYGVISYSVSQRVQEIGIRMALGAVPGDIRGMVVKQTLVLVLIGTAFGVAGGAAIAQAARSILYEVSPVDPATYIGVVTILSLVAALSAAAPVRRATHVDPLLALRAE
jgi:putative ABC transport system permease protein